MKVTTESVATREVVLSIEPDADVVARGMRKAAREMGRTRPVPGFRPGKAPYPFAERVLGRELILNAALRDMADDLYRRALEESGLEAVDHGQLDVASQDPLVLKIPVSLQPVVNLGDYHALHIDPEPQVAVTDEQVEAQVLAVRRRHAQYETVERAVQMGDQIVVSIQGTAAGESVIDQKETTIIVEDSLPPPGFAEALLGLVVGEAREFSLTYPESYEEGNLAGKTVQFSVKVTTVRQVILPEANDDLAKMAGDYETLADLREALAAQLNRRLESEAAAREANRAMEAIVSVSSTEYPAILLQREVDTMVQQQRARIQAMGLTFEYYLRAIGQTEEQLRETMRPQAERRLVRDLLLREFAKAEGIAIGADELGRELQGIAASYGDRAEEAMRRLQETDALFSVYGSALVRKAAQRLTDLLAGRQPPAAELEESVDVGASAEGGPAVEAPADAGGEEAAEGAAGVAGASGAESSAEGQDPPAQA